MSDTARTRAKTTPTSSRRGLLTRAASAIAAGAVAVTAARAATPAPVALPPPEHPISLDAALLAAHDKFFAADAWLEACERKELDPSEEEYDAEMERWYAGLEDVTDLTAHTRDGVLAKARVGCRALESTDNGHPERYGREELAALEALRLVVGRTAI